MSNKQMQSGPLEDIHGSIVREAEPVPELADEKMPVVVYVDKIAFDQAIKTNHGIDVWPRLDPDYKRDVEKLVRQSDTQAAILAAVAPLQAEIERLRKDFDAAIDAATAADRKNRGEA